MVAFVKVNDFQEDLGNAVHNFSSHTLKIALSNTAPASETSNPTADGNGILINVTQIAYTNLVGAAAPTLDTVTFALSAGVATLDAADEVLTASGGSVGPFQYIYLYNETATNDPLIGYWDNGSGITITDGNSTTLQFAAGGILTISAA